MNTPSRFTTTLLWAGALAITVLCQPAARGDETVQPGRDDEVTGALPAALLTLPWIGTGDVIGDDELSVTTGRGLDVHGLQGAGQGGDKVGVILWDEGKTPCCIQGGGGTQAMQMQSSSPVPGVDQLHWVQH